MAVSTVWKILNNSAKWEAEADATDNWKRKTRAASFPRLEKHLAEWVFRAQTARVPTNDDVLFMITRDLAARLQLAFHDTADAEYED